MYKEFFGMKNTPFVRGIPVQSLYSDTETDEINARLLSAAKDQSFALLVGDSGIGKTTAIRRMRNALSESEYTVLYLADSNLIPLPHLARRVYRVGIHSRWRPCHALRIVTGRLPHGLSFLRHGTSGVAALAVDVRDHQPDILHP